MKLVSVIIPTFNRYHYLQEAVASVLSQTYQYLELIIVDDGSSDGTWEWLQSLSDKRIKIYWQPNAGPAIARNFGVAQAKGEFIAFLDSDDKWLSKKLETQIVYLQTHPEVELCQTEELWIRNGIRVNPKKKT